MLENTLLRRRDYGMREGDELALLAEATQAHLSLYDSERPHLYCMNVTWFEGALWMHGAPKGQRASLAPCRAVAQVQRTWSTIPSHFVDPELACPATTYYESVQLEGTLTRVTSLEEKARGLQAMMQHLQPEGGHLEIHPDERRYRAQLKGLDVLKLCPERMIGKSKLGQNLSEAKLAKVALGLWQRGRALDLETLARMAQWHGEQLTLPPTLQGRPDQGWRLSWSLSPAQRSSAATMCARGYWNETMPLSHLTRAWRESEIAIGAYALHDPERLIGCARAISDYGKRAWIYDVFVDEAHRGEGIGQGILNALIDHPALRGCAQLLLGTRDAQRLYAKLGFEDVQDKPRPYAITTMSRWQAS